jgi:hypothetical protein
MNDQELRALVREAIARHKGIEPHGRHAASVPAGTDPVVLLASHAQFAVPGGGDACIIEPSVPCNHCGSCKSYGH